MDGNHVGVGLGLAAALGWGLADFGGGYLSRSRDSTGVVLGSQVAGLLMVIGAAIALSQPTPSLREAVAAAIAGFGGAVAVTALYHGLGTGKMGRVAPIAAVVGAGLPASVDVVTGGMPSLSSGAGMLLAIVAIPMVSAGSIGPADARAVRLAVLAGLGTAVFYLAFSQLSASSALWGSAISKSVAVAIIAGWRATRTRPARIDGRGAVIPVVLVGLFDSVGTVMFLLAESTGRLGEAAVLASLYVVVTVLLARVVLAEEFGRRQLIGIAAAVTGIVLIGAPI